MAEGDRLRGIVRCKLAVGAAKMALAARTLELRTAVEALMPDLEAAVGELNVIEVDGQVYVVRFDMDEGFLLSVELPRVVVGVDRSTSGGG